jgi:N-acetylmuramic acid 6-phosphate etherase
MRARSLDDLTTEAVNAASAAIDTLSIGEALAVMNDEDARVAGAVRAEIPRIARVVEMAVASLSMGGRLIYAGAGTSGRLGCLDAAEIPPTFSMPPDRVIGLIAGGEVALRRAVEGAEDRPELGAADVAALGADGRDTLIGISASGRAPYVLGALAEAARRGARTAGLANNRPCEMEGACEVLIAPVVGPELISGSTRLKAGTAQKLVLNMISTLAMVRLGKTYGNLMVDLQPTNEKLRIRAQRLVAQIVCCSREEAARLLGDAGGRTRVALVAGLLGVSAAVAADLLEAAGGSVRAALARGRGE